MMRCDVLSIMCGLVWGSTYLLQINAVQKWSVGHLRQHHGQRLSRVFETYQGLSKIGCAEKCLSRIESHGCSGANFNKLTKECGLRNESCMTDTDAGHFVALTFLPTQTADCTDVVYLISGPNGIPDSSLTSSSSWSPNKPDLFAPNLARLNSIETLNGNAAWSAGTNDIQQWIQARFHILRTVKGIAIQGRDGIVYKQYVREFTVSYSTDCITFQDVSNCYGTTMKFIGNIDTTTIVTDMLLAPVTALCVRLHPTEWLNHISMRWDIIGC